MHYKDTLLSNEPCCYTVAYRQSAPQVLFQNAKHTYQPTKLYVLYIVCVWKPDCVIFENVE